MKSTRLAALIAGLALLVSICTYAEEVALHPDGSTPERAVVFPDIETSFEAIPLEEEWVEAHHPEAEVVQQDLIQQDGKLFDRLTLRTRDGETRIVFFDLTTTTGEAP